MKLLTKKLNSGWKCTITVSCKHNVIKIENLCIFKVIHYQHIEEPFEYFLNAKWTRLNSVWKSRCRGKVAARTHTQVNTKTVVIKAIRNLLDKENMILKYVQKFGC